MWQCSNLSNVWVQSIDHTALDSLANWVVPCSLKCVRDVCGYMQREAEIQ